MNRYYYQADTIKFYQMPQVFYKPESQYVKMKSLSKELYMLLMDRNSLSIANGWFDKDGRIFFYFKQDDLRSMLNTSNKTLINSFNQLVEMNLIEVVRQGVNKPNKIYLLKPESQEHSGSVKITHQEVENLHPNHTEFNKTEIKTLKHDIDVDINEEDKNFVVRLDIKYEAIGFKELQDFYGKTVVTKKINSPSYKKAITNVTHKLAYLKKCLESDRQDTLLKQQKQELQEQHDLFTTQTNGDVVISGYDETWMDYKTKTVYYNLATGEQLTDDEIDYLKENNQLDFLLANNTIFKLEVQQ